MKIEPEDLLAPACGGRWVMAQRDQYVSADGLVDAEFQRLFVRVVVVRLELAT